MGYKYAIVTPVKDEERYFERTAQSVLAQELRPCKWAIINDGSRDRTGAIIERLAATHDWIIPIHNAPCAHRKPGGEGVLSQGLRHLHLEDYHFLVRMDGDLSFQPSYFAKLFTECETDLKLGIASGVCYVPEGEGFVEEKHPRFHTRGPLKTYRLQCFLDIGGLESDLGWDTIDEIRANMLGWRTKSFSHLRIIHLRRTQTANGVLKGTRNLGRASYYTGYHPVYAILRGIAKMVEEPYVMAGLALLAGYFEGYLKNSPRVDDPALISYLRRQQINRILGRKTIWK